MGMPVTNQIKKLFFWILLYRFLWENVSKSWYQAGLEINFDSFTHLAYNIVDA